MNKKLHTIKSFAESKADYLDFYQRTLPNPQYVQSVLEIGFNLDSLHSLAEVFPGNTLIHVMDFFDESKPDKKEIESLGFFVYDLRNGDSKNPKSLTSISSQFNVIIDRGELFKLSRQLVFNQMFCNNLSPHGIYYIESLRNDEAIMLAKALFDADRTFHDKSMSEDSVNKIIDLSEWSDMSSDMNIAGFRKVKASKQKSSKVDPKQVMAGIDPVSDKNEATPRQETFTLPAMLNVKMFGADISTVQVYERYGPVKKNILVSFLGKAHELPEIFAIYSSNPDFYFADFDRKSERYQLEMSRSIFSICANDTAIVNALIQETIPVVISHDDILPAFYDHKNIPCILIFRPSELQKEIGQIYRNHAYLNTLVQNGKLLLKKLSS